MKLPETPTVDWSPGYEWPDGYTGGDPVACDAALIVSDFTVPKEVAEDIRANGGEPTIVTLEIATDRKPYGSGQGLVGIEMTRLDVLNLIARLTRVLESDR